MSDLPFETEEEKPRPTEPETLASNVLIVDDEPVVRDVFKRLLAREQDMVVSVAEDAEQGLELIKQQRFELLITDKNLPGMGGIELIAEARAVRPMIEAVMITGYASSESLISAFAAGASDYLVKPFDDLKVVRAKVRAALQRRLDRSRSQISSKDVARQAAALLGQGKDAPEAVWRKLDTKFAKYEHAIRDGGGGTVMVVGTERTVDALVKGGVVAQRAEPRAPEVLTAEVVVIETGPQFDWHPLAEKLMPLPPDVVLVAGPESDLSDLLEAISLRVDLVGFGGHAPARLLPDRVKANLMRRSVERAQEELVIALNEFKQSLRTRLEAGAPPPPETGSGTGIEVNPPLAAIAAVPLVARHAAPAPPAGPPAPAPGKPPASSTRSPITPSIPIPATVLEARQQRAAAVAPGTSGRSPVTPSAPIPAAGAPAAPATDDPQMPGSVAPRHKAPASARVSTPSVGVPARLTDAGGAPRAPVHGAPAGPGPGGAPRRPTGSFPQITPASEDPATPAQGAPAAGAAPAGAPRRPTGSFPQITPPSAEGPAAPATASGPPRRTGSYPQITPEPAVDPGSLTGAPGSGAPRPTGRVPMGTPEDAPAPRTTAAPRSPAEGAPGLGARRPSGLSPQLSSPGAVPGSVTPVPGTGAMRRPTPRPLPHVPGAAPGEAPHRPPGGVSQAAPHGAAPGVGDPMHRPPGGAPQAAPHGAIPGAVASGVGDVVHRPPGGLPQTAPRGPAAPGTGDAMHRPPSGLSRATPQVALPASPARRPTPGPLPQVTPEPTPGPGAGHGPPPHVSGSPSPAPSSEDKAMEALPLEWTPMSSAPEAPAPAAAPPSIPVITATESDLSLDDAFSEWAELSSATPQLAGSGADQPLDSSFSGLNEPPAPPRAPMPPPPPAAPPRRSTGSFPQATPPDPALAPSPGASAAARRRAASPFPIMTVAEAESTLKAAQAQAPSPGAQPPHSMQGRPLAPTPGVASNPPRRSTGSFPQAPTPQAPQAAHPAPAPQHAPAQDGTPPKPKPPNGGGP